MLFRAGEIYEDKLSEKVDDNNKYKEKLVEMEKPVTQAPIYSFLVMSLMVYVWLFLLTMVYYKAPHLDLSIFVVVFTMIGVFLTYKRNFFSSNENRLRYYTMLPVMLLISIYIGVIDTGVYSNEEIKRSFLFTLGIGEKSYIALSILAFFAFGISKTYPVSYYEIYRNFSSSYNKKDNSLNKNINKMKILYIICILLFPCVFQNAFNPYTDSYNRSLKCLSVFVFAAYPEFIYFGYALMRYYGTYKKAKKLDQKTDKNEV